MLTFMQGAGKKKRALVVITPDDLDRMKAGKPIAIDFSQNPSNKANLIAVVGFTPDPVALQKALDETENGRWRVDTEFLLKTLQRCKDLPEKRTTQ